MGEVELFIDGLDFGEGPRWHENSLWYSDFFQHRVYKVDIKGQRETVLELDNEQPSGLGWLPDGNLLVVGMLRKQVLKWNGKKLEVHADLSKIATSHCNDMVVNKNGDAYVGNFGFDYGAGEEPLGASLALIKIDCSVSSVAENLQFPNGSVITPDGETLIVGETFASRYTAFTIKANGTLSEKRIWAETPGRLPDGCCLDEEGAIWFADAIRPEIVRLHENGEISRTITLPETSGRAFACMLGGEKGNTLFALTAQTDPQSGHRPGEGAIWQTNVEIPHAGIP